MYLYKELVSAIGCGDVERVEHILRQFPNASLYYSGGRWIGNVALSQGRRDIAVSLYNTAHMLLYTYVHATQRAKASKRAPHSPEATPLKSLLPARLIRQTAL